MSIFGIDLGSKAISGYANQDELISEVMSSEGSSLLIGCFPAFVEFNRDGTVRHIGIEADDDYYSGIDAPII